ncbi:MAG: ketoacyl-ACP synthase III [Candidatus Aminicenantes bacterium]|nr:ketoacyl-ACP synthase III [Candidatus Aminicenantes bacterium]
MDKRTIITGIGHYVPPRVVTNFDLEKLMDTSDEWIRQRSGIIERRHVELGVGSSDLAVEAARRAIADSGSRTSDIDLIIAATLSPDHYFPGIGVLVQAKLDLPPIGAIDVRNQCSGFIYALSIGDQYIRTGAYKKILLVAAEVQSTNLNYSDEGRDMAVLFGDGAGALILEPNEHNDGRGILSTHLFADGRHVTDLWMEKPGCLDKPAVTEEMVRTKKFFPRMDGKNVFKNASVKMPEAVRAALQHNGLTVEDVALLIPHQANDRISQMVAHNLKIPLEKVMRNISKYGNTTAASIPIALHEALQEGRIKPGDVVALTSFGSGYTWASALIRW